MAQQDVEKVLKKAKKPLTTKQIAAKLEIGPGSVAANLNRMLKYDKNLRTKYVRAPYTQSLWWFEKGK